MKEHNCVNSIEDNNGKGFMTSGYRQEGEKITCPKCNQIWMHVCDEAEGCFWRKI